MHRPVKREKEKVIPGPRDFWGPAVAKNVNYTRIRQLKKLNAIFFTDGPERFRIVRWASFYRWVVSIGGLGAGRFARLDCLATLRAE